MYDMDNDHDMVRGYPHILLPLFINFYFHVTSLFIVARLDMDMLIFEYRLRETNNFVHTCTSFIVL